MAYPFFPGFFPFTFALFPPLPPFESCSMLMLGLLFLWDLSVSAIDIWFWEGMDGLDRGPWAFLQLICVFWVAFEVLVMDGWAGNGCRRWW